MKANNVRKASIIFFLWLTGFAVQAQTQQIFVDVNSTYTGTPDGTEAKPYKDIAAAVNTLNNATMNMHIDIIVKDGIYKPTATSRIIIWKSRGGKNGLWLTLKAAGSNAIIDGENLFNVKYAALIAVTQGAEYVRIQGFQLRNQRCNIALDSTRSLPGGGTQLVRDVKYGLQVSGNSKHIELVNNTLYNMSWTPAVDPMKPISSLTESEKNILRNAIGSDNLGAISVLGSDSLAMEDIVIKGNEIHHITPGWTEAIAVNGYLIGFQITDNLVHDIKNIGIVAAGNYQWVINDPNFYTPPSQNYARNGLIKNNKVWECYSPIATAAGIYCDGSRNVTVEGNTVWNCQVGISIGNETINSNSGGHKVLNNLLYGNQTGGIVAGVGWDLAHPEGRGNYVDNVYISGNTLYKNNKNGVQPDPFLALASDYAELIVQSDIKNLTVENNILYARTTRVVSFGSPFSPSNASFKTTNKFDYNQYYTESTANPPVAVFDWSQLGVPTYDFYGTFDWYRVNRTDQDVHSAFGNPLFVNAATLDFRLQATSPAVNSGNPAYVAGSSERDRAGVTRVQGGRLDKGAYESSVGAPPTVITIDGSTADWAAIPAIATGTLKLSSLKLHDDSNYLYFLLEGNLSDPNYQVFINADNNPSTGYYSGLTTTEVEGFDYMIENGFLQKFTGTNQTDWTWTSQGVTGLNVNKNGYILEIRVALSSFTSCVAPVVKVRARTQTTTSAISDVLPGYANPSAVYTRKFTPSGAIVMDGNAQDWYCKPVLSTTGTQLTSIRAYDDATHLYVLLQGTTTTHFELHLNTDNNNGTGYKDGNFTYGGSEYILEDYTLSRYNGDGWSWSWINPTTSDIQVNKNATTIEIKIAKNKFTSLASTIQMRAYNLDAGYNETGHLPNTPAMAFYTLGSGARTSAEFLTTGTLAGQNAFAELQVFPNPSRGMATIAYTLDAPEQVQIDLFTMQGRLVKTLLNTPQKAGYQEVAVDKLTKGMYFIRVVTGSAVRTRALLVE